MRSGTVRISRPVNRRRSGTGVKRRQPKSIRLARWCNLALLKPSPGLCLRLSPLCSGSQREREKREAIWRLNPAIPEDAREEALHGGILSYQPDIIT